MEESSDDRYAALDAFAFSSDVEEDEVPDGTRDEEVMLKRCVTCKAHKPLAEYCKDASRCDEKSMSCKVCRNHAWRNRRKKRKEEGDDAGKGNKAAQGTDKEPPQKRGKWLSGKGTTFMTSKTPAYQSTRLGGRPTLPCAAMRCRSRKTSTYKG